MKIDVPFIDEISRLAMIKLLDFKTGRTNTFEGKVFQNTGFLDVTNNSSGRLILSKDEAVGIVDLRSRIL